MRIVIAPDSFNGSMTVALAAAAMASGIRRVLPGLNSSLCRWSTAERAQCKRWRMPQEASWCRRSSATRLSVRTLAPVN